MAKLPRQLSWEQARDKWAATLDPITVNPLNNVIILKNINLVIGNNVINHLLGQVQQGWFQVDAQGPAVIYRSAPYNSTTLQLNSSAAVTISLGVY